MPEWALGKRAVQVFVQIRAANATILNPDFYFLRSGVRLFNFFHPDISNAVVHSLFHYGLLPLVYGDLMARIPFCFKLNK
jgi:hypothetical protein